MRQFLSAAAAAVSLRGDVHHLCLSELQVEPSHDNELKYREPAPSDPKDRRAWGTGPAGAAQALERGTVQVSERTEPPSLPAPQLEGLATSHWHCNKPRRASGWVQWMDISSVRGARALLVPHVGQRA